ARFAHLLPASQSHHHRGAGGLLRHSLEVGLWALPAIHEGSRPYRQKSYWKHRPS
ncbi:TraI domain-containing protein, partial [Streptococcus pneumoniae]|uniref:TraI domain-containing protein n=1 Tax=Streptococcus pneumoniae TaxID=1313 RepID=UPI00122F0A9C